MSDCANEQLLIRSLFICFSTFLTTEVLPKKRLPYKWRTNLRRDLTTGPITTGRVFFESGGAQAWAAYEAVKPTTLNCQGQAEKRRCFAELDRQSLEFKADLARMVGAVVPHPTLAGVIAPMAQEGLNLLGRPVDAEPSIQVASAPPAKRPRIDEGPRDAGAGPSRPPCPTSLETRGWDFLENTFSAARHRDHIWPAPARQIRERAELDEFVGADLRGLRELVSPYMANAIKTCKDNGTLKAEVAMTFPVGDLDLPCSITFEILDPKIEFLAWKLFNAHLERVEEAWFLLYDNSARKVGIGPEFTLQSCTTEAIPSFFGPLITAGNVASPRRQMEESAGLFCVTETITMELHEVGKGALITVSLGSVEACQIFEKLKTE